MTGLWGVGEKERSRPPNVSVETQLAKPTTAGTVGTAGEAPGQRGSSHPGRSVACVGDQRAQVWACGADGLWGVTGRAVSMTPGWALAWTLQCTVFPPEEEGPPGQAQLEAGDPYMAQGRTQLGTE